MKREIKYSILVAALLLLLPIGFSSCLKNEPFEGDACIITSIPNASMRGGALTIDDETIEKVRVLVFVKSNGGLEKNVLYVKDTDEFQNPFHMCGLVQGMKDIYVVANESESLNLGAITNKSQLLEKMADAISTPIDPSKPLMMTGELTSQNLTATNLVTIPLTRIATKISLKFKKENADDNVKITKVSLLSNTGKTTLYPVPTATSVYTQTYWNWVHPLTSPLDVAVSETVIAGHESIYLYENLTADATDKTHATQLEVEALFNNIPTTYRVYVNETVAVPGDGTPGNPNSSTVDVADHLYKIKRNHHYVITGIIKNLGEFNGLEIIYEIMPWVVVEKAVYMGHGYNVIVDEDGTVTVKNTEPVCAPHKIELKTLGSFTFEDGTTSKIFESLTNYASVTYKLNTAPDTGAGDYLEVWYNDVKVKTFTK